MKTISSILSGIATIAIATGSPIPKSVPTSLSAGDRSGIQEAKNAANLEPADDPLITQQAYLKALNAEAGDNFGTSVAIDGDTIVIGANGNTKLTGAAYVFTRSGSTWTQQASLKASNAAAEDRFGGNVAISGNVIIAGAIGEDSNAAGVDANQANNSAKWAGAAYIFAREGTTWKQQAYLKASNAAAGDQFGWSVAASGETVVVGANAEQSDAKGVNGNQLDNSLAAAGAAYVFTRSGKTWSQQAYLKASNTGKNDTFGWSLAISENTLIAGAPGESSDAPGVNGNQSNNRSRNSGAAYIFTRRGTEWTQQAYVKAADFLSGDFFGARVAISGDTAVAGAFYENSHLTGINPPYPEYFEALYSGAAYVFTRHDVTWTQQAYLKASNTGEGDLFGISVAVSGKTAVVGAYYEDSGSLGVDGDQTDEGASESGAAYIFNDLGPPRAPEIEVKQLAGSILIDGETRKNFGTVKVGKTGSIKTFIIKNTGTANLTGLTLVKKGVQKGDFIITAPARTSLGPDESTRFTVTFKPAAIGTRNAAIHIKSNDADENPFDIKLTGSGSAP